jgi:hypothetical protein
VIRAATATLCMLLGLYWLAVGSAGSPTSGGGFRFLVGSFSCVWLAAAVYPLVGRTVGNRGSLLFPAAALGFAIFAAVGPVLLSFWTREDYQRLIWIINQHSPCAWMGGGPGAVFVLVSSWLVALLTLGYAIASGLTVRRVLAGLTFGLVLCAATAVAMFPAPEVLAFILGCL